MSQRSRLTHSMNATAPTTVVDVRMAADVAKASDPTMKNLIFERDWSVRSPCADISVTQRGKNETNDSQLVLVWQFE